MSQIHILLMSLAFAVFAVSFLMGLAYLLQQFQLKSRHSALLLKWLPPLETIDGIHYRVLVVGFVLLSLGILTGGVLSKSADGWFFTGDPRQVAAVGAWALYGLFLNVRLKAGWRGRRGILLSLLGFIGVVLGFLALRHRGL